MKVGYRRWRIKLATLVTTTQVRGVTIVLCLGRSRSGRLVLSRLHKESSRRASYSRVTTEGLRTMLATVETVALNILVIPSVIVPIVGDSTDRDL
jgi:hypothetical protein